MGRARLILVILLAMPLALGAAFFARSMVASKPKAVTAIAPPPAPTTEILVAKTDLAVGDRLAPEMLQWKPWPVGGLNVAYISKTPMPATALGASGSATAAGTAGAAVPGSPAAAAASSSQVAPGSPAAAADPTGKLAADAAKKAADVQTAIMGDHALEQLSGWVVREAMVAGEPVIAAKLVKPNDSGVMAVTLTPGMRAMSVPLSPETGAAGFIQPGDHVDVVQTRRMAIEGKGNDVVASTVMKNVRVIAIDASTKPDEKSASTAGATATLEVSPEQAETIVLARAQGELTLVLRSYADATGPTVEGLIRRAEALRQPVVRVFRSGSALPEEVKVTR